MVKNKTINRINIKLKILTYLLDLFNILTNRITIFINIPKIKTKNNISIYNKILI